MDSNLIEIGSHCLRDEAQAILDLIPRLEDSFVHAVNLIYNCKGKLIVTGVGKSGHIGSKIAATLASTGTPSFFINPLDAYHGDLGMIQDNDVVMAISYSGSTDELLRFIPLLLDRKIPIIGISGNPDSLLAQYSTCHLNISVDHEADPLNLAPTSSTTVTLAIGDALACALIEKRNFKSTDFARFHPGGSLGKRLLSRVKDYMVSTNLPIVSPTDKVSDTIIEISKRKFGLAIVEDGNTFVGVVSDGDVRRAMQFKKEHFFMLSVSDIMTRTPKTINGNAKLEEATVIMRTYNVHTLIVVDDDCRAVGLIDAFACL